VALGALVTFAVFGGTGLAGSSAKPVKAQYGPGQYNNPNKVTICHKSKVTIRVSVNALPAHEAHGDDVGTCAAAAAAAKAKVKQAKVQAAKAKAAKAKQSQAATSGESAASTTTGGPAKGNGNGNGNGQGSSHGNGKGNGKS
jgi:hypothetical protein